MYENEDQLYIQQITAVLKNGEKKVSLYILPMSIQRLEPLIKSTMLDINYLSLLKQIQTKWRFNWGNFRRET